MEDSILAKITKLKLKIPEFVRPAANYESFKLSDNLVYISGQLPIRDGQLMYRGKVGQSVSKAQAIQASKQCAMNIVSQLNEVTKGHLDRVKKIIKLTGYVACINTFTEQHLVLDAASTLLVDIFGNNGVHARAAVGCCSLPLNAPVEIEAIAEIQI